MHITYLMRYSFVGRSDWRSEASQDAALLLNSERLEKRFGLFQKVALQSLADQQDKDFALVILAADAMPAEHRKRVEELAKDTLGTDRAHVLFRPPGRASDEFTKYRQRTFSDYAYTAQVILDDDDAVAMDFTDRMRLESRAAISVFQAKQDYTLISHARGLNLRFLPDGVLEVGKRNMPAAAQGLAVVAPSASVRSPFNLAHKKILDRRPVRVVHGPRPMYIRTVHDTNDSRARVNSNLVSAEMLPALAANHFPLLAPILADPAYTLRNAQSDKGPKQSDAPSRARPPVQADEDARPSSP